MKESRFIELLNLYIDQQISPAEAEELEKEIARSPAHYRTYLQYCRMHRACVVLFENFQVPAAPLAQAMDQADGKVTAFPERRFRVRRAMNAAGLAVAAACVALVVVTQVNQQVASTPPAAKPAASEVVQINVPAESFRTAAADAPARSPEFRTVFTARKIYPAQNRVAIDPSRMDWMNRIEFSPMRTVSDQPVVFSSPSASPSTGLSFQQVRNSGQTAVEMTAFKFEH
ncbi:MAG TPA: hypothetical protein VFB27_01220 [Opitutaceae bacterium]|nr:hypothetical protein [Opitutaceae bacterium]